MKAPSLIIIWIALAIVLTSGAAFADDEATAWDLVYKARMAASDDKHRASINFYLSAIEKNPAVLSEVAIELAHQYTWAELPELAIYWYEYTLLDTLLGKPRNLDAELGIARALAWDDRLADSDAHYRKLLADSGDRKNDVLTGWAKTRSWQRDYVSAEEMYREVLANDPDNKDARLGLAEVTLWSGHPRDAQAMYQDVLDDYPDDAEVIRGLARAQSAAGRPDVALKTLGAAATGDEFASEFKSIDKAGSINNSNTLLYRDNTTDGDYRAVIVLLGMDVANLTRIGVEYTKGRMTQDGRPDTDRDQIMVPMSQRFSESLAINLSPGYQWNRFDPVTIPPSTEPRDQFDLFVWDAWGTWMPKDRVRLDLANSRQTLTIPQTVFRQIDLTTTSLGLDWRMSPRVIGYLVPSYRTYSDGNSRLAIGQRLDWTTPLRLPVWSFNTIVLYQTFEYFEFAEELDHGYYNPPKFAQLMGGVRLITDIGRRLNLNIAVALGSQREGDLEEWASTGAFEAEARFQVSGNGFLRAGYIHSGSRLRTADGFRAKGFFLSFDIYVPR